ncbi:MAG: hypothetical protein U9Q77_13595 [Candidatus Marinimicrobia bacterium]|nr:hypothetical protein [Candidatus Neomarinimicrobiota bacterium]
MANNRKKTCIRVDHKTEWQPVINLMKMIEIKKKPYLPRDMKLVQLKKEHQATMIINSVKTEMDPREVESR